MRGDSSREKGDRMDEIGPSMNIFGFPQNMSRQGRGTELIEKVIPGYHCREQGPVPLGNANQLCKICFSIALSEGEAAGLFSTNFPQQLVKDKTQKMLPSKQFWSVPRMD